MISAATSTVLCAAMSATAASRECSPGPRSISVTGDFSETAVHAQIWQAICNMRTDRDRLTGKIDHKHNLQTAFDSTVIGLGVASVAATGFGAAPIVLGGIGLGGLGVQSYRDYYAPEKQGGQLLLAVHSTRCVASNAEQLLNINPSDYWQAMRQLRAAVANVNATSAVLTSNSQADSDGRSAAKQAIAAAESTFAGLLAEADAYNKAASVIDQAHDSINDFVDKVEHRGSVNFTDVQSQLSTSFAAQKQAASQTEAARSQLYGSYSAQATAQSSAANPAMSGQPAPPDALTPNSAVARASAALAGSPVSPGVTPGGMTSDAAALSSTMSLNAARALASPSSDVANGAASVRGTSTADNLNAQAVAALNDLAEQALKFVPTAQVTPVNTAITACVASLAN